MAKSGLEPAQLVGVADISGLAGLKQHLLLVDQIAIIHHIDRAGDWKCRSTDPALAADLDWLESRGVVLRAGSDALLENTVENTGIAGNRKRIRDSLLKFESAVEQLEFARQIAIERPVRQAWSEMAIAAIGPVIDFILDFSCRLECQILRTSTGKAAVSLRSPLSTLYRSSNQVISSGDIQNIIIKKFPHPDGATSLERILEFRSDPQVKSKLVALRRWSSKLTRTDLSPIEVAQELDWLLNEYEEHMRLHEMKINKGAFETVTTVAAEAVEDLVKVRWGKLAKSLFKVSNRKIELMEAELKAPGRDIAYISRAHKIFTR